MSRSLIDKVVEDFYEAAKNDFLIGYHFRHIDDFDVHIPKIQRFWYLSLLDLTTKEKKKVIALGVPKNIINSHQYLKVKPGEIGRWVTLFKQILDQQRVGKLGPEAQLIKRWHLEVLRYENLFLKSKVLFPSD